MLLLLLPPFPVVVLSDSFSSESEMGEDSHSVNMEFQSDVNWFNVSFQVAKSAAVVVEGGTNKLGFVK